MNTAKINRIGAIFKCLKWKGKVYNEIDKIDRLNEFNEADDKFNFRVARQQMAIIAVELWITFFDLSNSTSRTKS